MAVDKLVDSTQLNSDLTSIANSIRTKGGTSAQLAFPAGFISAIEAIPTSVGPSVVEEKDVNFYDYDGTLLYSYTAAEFAELTALPTNPTHAGLTAQGWNWSLSDAQTFVAAHGFLDIGHTYITDDGKTRLYIHLDSKLSLYLNLIINDEILVDWGDGSAAEVITGSGAEVNTPHTYPAIGDYVIEITIVRNTFAFPIGAKLVINGNQAARNYNSGYARCLQKIEFGSGLSSTIGQYSFQYLINLKSCTIPLGVTSIDQNAFGYNFKLNTIVIPNGVLEIGGNAFTNSLKASRIILPNGITNVGNNAFTNSAISNVILPDSVTTLGTYAYGQAKLSKISIPSGITAIPTGLCNGYGNNPYNSVIIPNSITSIGDNAFNSAYCLDELTIPSSVVSIGANAFSNAYNLTELIIPSSVTSIGNSAFSGCYGLASIKFEGSTPPTLGGSNVFFAIPTDCIIYVPRASLSAYTSATNYPSSNTYTYVGY